MKRYPKALVILSVALILGALYVKTQTTGGYIADSSEEETISVAVRKPEMSEETVILSNRKQVNTGDRPEQVLLVKPPTREEFMEEIWRKLSVHDFKGWLDSFDPSSKELAYAQGIVGLITKDLDLIREALANDPDNAILLYIGSTVDGLEGNEYIAFSQALYEAESDNANAAYLYAWRLVGADDFGSALDVMAASIDMGEMHSFTHDLSLALKEAFLAAGLSEGAAAVRSVMNLELSHVSAYQETATKLMGLVENDSEAEAVRAAVASMGSRVSDFANDGYAVELLAGLSVEKQALTGLADDTPSAYRGLSVAEARQAIDQDMAMIRNVLANQLIDIEDMAPSQMVQYIEKVQEVGEFKAMKWASQAFADESP